MQCNRYYDDSHDKCGIRETPHKIKEFTIYYYEESLRRKRRKKWPQLAYSAFKGLRKVRGFSYSMVAPFYDILI